MRLNSILFAVLFSGACGQSKNGYFLQKSLEPRNIALSHQEVNGAPNNNELSPSPYFVNFDFSSLFSGEHFAVFFLLLGFGHPFCHFHSLSRSLVSPFVLNHVKRIIG